MRTKRTTLAALTATGLLVIAACSAGDVAPVSGGGSTSSPPSTTTTTSEPSDSPSPKTEAGASIPAGYREVTVDRAVISVPEAWQDVDFDPASADLDRIDMPEAIKQQMKMLAASGLRPVLIGDPSSRTAANKGYMTNVTVIRQPIAPRLDGDDAQVAAAAESQARTQGVSDAQAEVVQVNGQDALHTTGTLPINGSTIFVEEYVLPHDRSSHVVSLGTDDPDRYREQFETIVRTFRVSE